MGEGKQTSSASDAGDNERFLAMEELRNSKKSVVFDSASMEGRSPGGRLEPEPGPEPDVSSRCSSPPRSESHKSVAASEASSYRSNALAESPFFATDKVLVPQRKSRKSVSVTEKAEKTEKKDKKDKKHKKEKKEGSDRRGSTTQPDQPSEALSPSDRSKHGGINDGDSRRKSKRDSLEQAGH